MDLSGPLVLLEDARSGHEAVRLYTAPDDVLCARTSGEVETVLEQAERQLRSGKHIAGYFSYELGYLGEPRLAPLLQQSRGTPLVWLGVFPRCAVREDRSSLLSGNARAYAGPLTLEWDEAEYSRRFQRVHELIARGDAYQVNLTFRAGFPFVGDPWALYEALKPHARAGYCAFVADRERHILSLSPELFFEISADGTIRARPMKGTAARGSDPVSDAHMRAHLLASDKERAENLMIVDLLRNDLARIADVGSVAVDSLFEIETLPTLHQLVSTVTARKTAPIEIAEILRALFPCGSVTGAPKIRAMQIIRELEQSLRGVYCGAIGAFSPDGPAVFNVAIRTLTITGNRGELGVGGGVVYDSRATEEYRECLLKARYYEAARVPISLIETLRWSPGGGFVRGERHLARMALSASVFGIPFELSAVRGQMAQAVAGAEKPMRVRLTLSETGQFSARAGPLDEGSRDRPWRYRISAATVVSQDVLLAHKTSRRDLFDDEHASAVRAGLDEVLFLNERGELTEGSRTNIFAEIDGRLVTPPLSCGLLDGCLRRELLEEKRCTELVLMPADLRRARAVFVGNSLRGLRPAVPAAASGSPH